MNKWKRIVVAVAGLVVVYHLLFGALYFMGFRVYRIPSSAMEPTIQKNEMVIGRLSDSYKNRVQRLDIVVYTLPNKPGEIYAKRVAALAGERIVIDKDGLSVGGRKMPLPQPVLPAGRMKVDLVIPSGTIYLLGDNTSNSMDSRYHGPVPLNDVLGYLVFKH